MRIATTITGTPATTNGSDLRIRRAEATDLDALLDLEQRSFSGDRISRAQYRRHLDSDSALVLIATAERQVCGSAVLFLRRRSRLARLYSLATHPAARGRGIGSALLDAIARAARQRGCRALRLEVRSDNATAIALYERRGFRRIGSHAGYYEDGADALRLERVLD